MHRGWVIGPSPFVERRKKKYLTTCFVKPYSLCSNVIEPSSQNVFMKFNLIGFVVGNVGLSKMQST